MDDPRVIKTKQPIHIIVSAVAIGVLVFAFIVYAVWQSGSEIKNARMTGTIVEKEFTPLSEEQIVIGKQGVTARKIDGEYVLTVEVPQKDGTQKKYYVWVNKPIFDALKVGDSYDVGPALVRE